MMQHNEGGGGGVGETLQLWDFLDIDENIQKIIKKTIRIFYSILIVKFDCLDKL